MTHKEEIRQIRKMLNLPDTGEVSTDNFAKTVYDEEVQDGVVYLPKDLTGLDYGLIVDEDENYIAFKHPMCLYVVAEEYLIPITIEDEPKVYGLLKNSGTIIGFVKEYQKELIDTANCDLCGGDFIDVVRQGKNEIRQLRKILNLPETGEISTDNFAKIVYDEEVQDGVAYLEPSVTGLEYGLIIDEAENYIIFRHPECVYVVDGDRLVPITINGEPKIYGKLDAEDLMDFVREYQRELLDVTHDKMSISQLRQKIKKEA